MNKIKIGWSEVSLVPEGRKVDLVGQFYERISDEVETPIYATAMAMECGEDQAIFVACDLVSTSHSLLEEVRRNLPDDCGIDKSKLMISAIHTHTAPGYSGRGDRVSLTNTLMRIKPEHVKYVPLVASDDPNIIRGDEMRQLLVERICRAVIEAWNRREVGAYACAFGRAAVGLCRRVCYDDGSAKMWGDTNSANFTELESGNDSGIEMLFTYDKSKKLTGVIANVACPAQVLEHQNFISSDYVGKVREMIKKKYGNEVAFLGLISPAGDMCPRDLVRWVDADIELMDPNIYREKLIERRADPSMFDVKGCEKAARRIATEIFFELEDVKDYVTETELYHKSINTDLPLRRVTIAEYENALKEANAFFEKCGDTVDFADNAHLLIHSGTIERFELQKTKDMFTIEMHVIRLGDIAFATNPFELFLNYGNQMRARSLAKQTFLIQLSCGSFGYLPTEKAEKGSHYSAFVSSGMTGHVGGEMLVRKTLTEINSMFTDGI